MKNQTRLFKDLPDLVIKITDEEIINITGSVGSGKSTHGLRYKNNKDYAVIGLDSVGSNGSANTMNNDVLELREILKEKFNDLTLFETVYYDEIVKFIESKNKKGIIEGGHLCKVNKIEDLKGTLIIKRTARFKCFYRASYRDFKNPYWRKGLTKFGLIKRFFHCYKRRFHHIFPQGQIESFIVKALDYKNSRQENQEFFNKIIGSYNLGTPVDVPVKVTGGLMHTTYKFKTTKQTYIVKLLNPNIMERSGALENFRIADEFENVLLNNNIKLLPAIKFDGKTMLKIDNQYFYIFEFYEGKSLPQKDIKTKHCKLVAEELAKIHNIEIKEEKFVREKINIDWNFYLNLAKEKNLEIYNLLINKMDLLNKSIEEGNRDIQNVPAFKTICHNDMDSKNILWIKDEFKIIDLECLCYSNPLIEFFSLALYWSGYEECNIDYELLETFIKTYFYNVKIDLKNIDWEVLYNVNYGKLEWLEFNLKRSFLIDCDSKEEQKIGINEVKETLKHILYYDKVKDDIINNFWNVKIEISSHKD